MGGRLHAVMLVWHAGIHGDVSASHHSRKLLQSSAAAAAASAANGAASAAAAAASAAGKRKGFTHTQHEQSSHASFQLRP